MQHVLFQRGTSRRRLVSWVSALALLAPGVVVGISASAVPVESFEECKSGDFGTLLLGKCGEGCR